MQIARVIGTVVSTQKHRTFEGAKLLLVQPVALDDTPRGTPLLAIDSVGARSDGGSNIYLSNRGTMVMPAELSIGFADGSQATVKLPIEMWNLGAEFVYRVPQKKRVGRAEVDPGRSLPDVDRANNVWPRASRSP